MREQMPQSDLMAIFGKFRQEIRKRFVEGKFLALRQDHHGHGGELFGDRRQAEISISSAHDSCLHVGQAVAFCEEDFVLMHDRYACAWTVQSGVIGESSIYFRLRAV